MKRAILLMVVGAAVAGALIVAFVKMSRERAAESEREKPVSAKSKVSRGPNGEVVVTVDEEAQRRSALKVAALAATRLEPEVKGYGRVLDPAPLASLAAELASASATAEASQKELERLKVLSAQDNSSARALQAAEAAARRDRAATDSARQHLFIAWGEAIAGRADLAALVQSLASGERALARVDLPAGEVLKAQPAGARLFALSDESNPIEAEFIGPAPAVDAQTQGQGFLFLIKAGSPRFAPGAAVLGYLRVAGDTQSGVVIPREAVVRFNGKTWVYIQTGAQTFARREIALDHPLAEGWFATHGLESGNRIVVVGAQTLLSEEQKYQIKLLD